MGSKEILLTPDGGPLLKGESSLVCREGSTLFLDKMEAPPPPERRHPPPGTPRRERSRARPVHGPGLLRLLNRLRLLLLGHPGGRDLSPGFLRLVNLLRLLLLGHPGGRILSPVLCRRHLLSLFLRVSMRSMRQRLRRKKRLRSK